MRMSFSRLAALAVALTAGVTLASCASSSAPIAGTGPNSQVFSVPASIVQFIQGSPNLHLGITNVDLYIDGKLVGGGPFDFESNSGQIAVPPGAHDFKLVQAGTLNPVFLEKVFTTAANTKYLIVSGGDASNHSTVLFFFVVPHYNTPAQSTGLSVFNASPRTGTADFYATGNSLPIDFELGFGVVVGGSSTNTIVGPMGNFCMSAYTGGTFTLRGGWPEDTSDEHLAPMPDCSQTLPPAPDEGPNINFILVDSGASPSTLSQVFELFDGNG